MSRPITIAINAQILPEGGKGGLETVTLGLLSALGRLDDSDDEYLVVTHPDNPRWLAEHLGPNQRIVSMSPDGRNGWARTMLGPLRGPISTVIRRSSRGGVRGKLAGSVRARYSASRAFFEGLGADVIHFPFLPMVVTDVPTIINPHDLQHRHFPEFFNSEAVQARERIYGEAFRQATVVAAGSEWAKEDFVEQYDLPRDRVQVIPWAAPLSSYQREGLRDPEAVVTRLGLTSPFCLYPAATWKHKNHLGLIEAMAVLRDEQGVTVNLVCTGAIKQDHWPNIERAIERLGLGDQVRFLGMVDYADLSALFRAARCLIFPSLFEPASAPIFEAWDAGLPVACSAVAGLPEQVGAAALLFDPTSRESLADALRRIWTDEDLRADLRRRGEVRSHIFTWERTAKIYRALYRKTAGLSLSDEDAGLLALKAPASDSPAT